MKKLFLSLLALFASASFLMSASLSGTYTSTQTISENSYVASGNEYVVNMSSGHGIDVKSGCTLTVQEKGKLLIKGSSPDGAGMYVYGTFKTEADTNVKVPRFVMFADKATLSLQTAITREDGSAFGLAVAHDNTTLSSTVSQTITQWDVRNNNFTLDFTKDVVYTFNSLSLYNVQSSLLYRNFNVNLTNFDDSNEIVLYLGESGAGYDVKIEDTKLVVEGIMTKKYGSGSTPAEMGRGTVKYNFVCDEDITINEMFDNNGKLTGYTISTIQAVPEPAEWAIILGAIALGFAVYRLKK